MNSKQIREKFLSFFKSHGHAVVPSSSLIPDDPSVLLTTAGMQQFKRYYTGELDAMKDFGSKNTASVQKSFRTSDIDEVGDESHLTFFEMLGNFSFGGYWKKEAIQYGHDFIAKEMKLDIEYVSIFAGDKEVPGDTESEHIWKSLGVKDIRKCGRTDNFWGPTGIEGPCGPTTEIYVKNTEGKSIEIWNIVFNEYYMYPDRSLKPLQIKGIDTGMGLERLAMVAQKVPTIFETDLFTPLMVLLPASPELPLRQSFSGASQRGEPKEMPAKTRRIVVDHARGIAFLLADGVRPSNKEAGYILRKLMRRVIFHEENSGYKFDAEALLRAVIANYKEFYPELIQREDAVCFAYRDEKAKFLKTLENGLKEMKKLTEISAADAFKLYESYGLPYEIIKESGSAKAKKLTREGFDEEFKKHQEISRAGQEKKFGGHGLILNTGELKAGNEEELNKVLRLHTATHLLQRALREVLGPGIQQMGSDITAERTRFDFSFSRKMTEEEKKKVEDLVNQKIKEDLPVQFVELPKAEAEKSGALYFFKEKYPEKVKVYFVGKDLKSAWSKEFCGGPHVKHTGIIGNFKIAKEEAIAAGVRRVRGVVD